MDDSRVQSKDSGGNEEQVILAGGKEQTAEKTTQPGCGTRPERIAPVAKDTSISTSALHLDEQRREEVRSSLGGILLVVLVLWLVLESSAEPAETN